MPTWAIILLSAIVSAALVVFLRQLFPPEKSIQHDLSHEYGVGDAQFRRSIGNLLPPALLDGNHVTPLTNGDEIFPAMLDAIAAAKHSICFESYIYWSGSIGQRFADSMIERSRAGVKVHVLLDWVGSFPMKAELIDQLKSAGIVLWRYHKPSWWTLNRMNNRTHRKLLIIDGKISFTGGVGISDDWLGDARSDKEWRDSHFRLEGPSVAQMQTAFMDNWMQTQKGILHTHEYFPELPPAGEMRTQVFSSGDREGAESVRLMYLLSINAADKTVRLSNAYFVPDDLSVQTLIDAVKRGVKVQIILPSDHSDSKIVRRASRHRVRPLLEGGVQIYEYQPTMYHCKVLIVDDCWTSVGSTNFDNRSFRLNDETNLNIYDAGLAANQIERFEEDLARSKPFTLADWHGRRWKDKLLDRAAAMLRTQL